MKIAITGAHSTGKSRFIKKLQNDLLLLNMRSIAIHHTPEGCPYPVEMSQSVEATTWITLKAMLRETEALKTAEIIILDRSIIDAWAYYSYWKTVSNVSSNQVLETALLETLKAWTPTYDIIVKTKIDESQTAKEKNIPYDNNVYRLGIEESINKFLSKNRTYNIIKLPYGGDDKATAEILGIISKDMQVAPYTNNVFNTHKLDACQFGHQVKNNTGLLSEVTNISSGSNNEI